MILAAMATWSSLIVGVFLFPSPSTADYADPIKWITRKDVILRMAVCCTLVSIFCFRSQMTVLGYICASQAVLSLVGLPILGVIMKVNHKR